MVVSIHYVLTANLYFNVRLNGRGSWITYKEVIHSIHGLFLSCGFDGTDLRIDRHVRSVISFWSIRIA